MKAEDLNALVKETFMIGENLLNKEFELPEFEAYVNNIKSISEHANQSSWDDIQARTIELIGMTNIQDLKLGFWKKIFNPYKHAKIEFWPGNSQVDIARRYIVTVNRRLPILLNEKKC